jgi:cytochrome c oxidase subunit 3
MGLLVFSLPPTILMNGAAVREQFGATRLWLLVATAFSVAITVVRAFELPRLGFRWDQHAYGSAFWLVLGIHCTHVLSGVVDFAMTLALMYPGRHRFEKKHYVDVESAGILWYFVVIEWLIAYPVLYLLPLGAGR